MCICSSHRKYLSPFFCCIVPYYVESCIFSMQIQICFLVYKYNFFTNLELQIRMCFYQTPSHGRKSPLNQGLSVLPSFCLSVWKFSWGQLIIFFLKLSVVLGAHVLLHVTARFFEKNLVAQKMGQMGQKWAKKLGFLNLLENLVIDFFGIWYIMKDFTIFCILAQIPYFGKICFLRYGPKCFWSIRLQDF